MRGDQLDDRSDRGCSTLKAGGYLTDHLHPQLLGGKGRGHVQPGSVGRHPQQVGVVVPRAQGRGKQRGAAGAGHSRADLRGRYHIAQTQGRQAAFTRSLALADIEEKMRVEQLADANELQRIEEKLQQRRVDAGGLLVELLLDQPDTVLQCLEESLR
ncbi:hypothetical protein D3C77_529720 [compost metagenome]